ncbi:hypothetical protein V6Z05_16940 [Leptospira venezuelensis]|uniref:hypothetical protein n=1 Tax=Leptospira venezuelensis TaxID=1958811 RepID=UPI0012FFBB10|nr:hypothetical protein [Leptospira venezuelensis]
MYLHEHIAFLFLSMVSFLIVNNIGEKIVTTGYERVSVSLPIDNAPAFNIVYRVLTPILLLVGYSVALSYTSYDYLNRNIAYVNYYYIGLRIAAIVIYQRILVVNWIRQIITYVGIIAITNFLDENYLANSTKILPDPTNLINELWIIIIIFTYNLLNKISVSPEDLDRRKTKYILKRYQNFSNKWGEYIVKSKGEIVFLEIISIMIYENFNRPFLFRKLETLLKYLKLPIHSTGIMQVQTDEILDDKRSIFLAVRFLRNAIISVLKGSPYSSLRYYYSSPSMLINEVVGKYNAKHDYWTEIDYIKDIINTKYGGNLNNEKVLYQLKRLVAKYMILRDGHPEREDVNYYRPEIDIGELKSIYFKGKYRK